MKKIIFRADGNSLTGLGHLYRIFALIELYKNDFEYILVTKENSTSDVIPPEYNLQAIPDFISIEKEPQWLNEKYPSVNHIIIADGYHFNSDYQKEIKKLNYKLVYIDDLTTEHMYANIVINHSLSVKPSDYKAESYTKFALGTKYAILRPQFVEAAKNARTVEKIDTVFVCFGGADQYDLTLTATKALLNIQEIKKINIVLGGAYSHKAVFELKSKNSKINIYQNISETELIKVMKECDLGIAPASNILYELCSIKMPILSGYYVENQKNIYKGCIENSIIFDGGNFENYSVEDFEKKIKKILTEGNYQKYLDAQSQLFDSNIKERFLNLIPKINYRKASIDDMMLLFQWANDPLSRSNSYFTEPIILETHKAWFEKKLNDKLSTIYIAEVENKPAGMIRYDVDDKQTVVGISIAQDYRGKGYASDFLIDTSELYFHENKQPILAYIKQENQASIKSFEKANYKKVKEEIVHGSKSFLYQLTKK